jgi:hypothetical protein
MDPLSVVASVATLIEAVAVVSGALKMLRSELADAPRSLCALINEISDLHILLESCESALRHWHKATPGSTFPVSLAKSNQIIESTHESVKELTNIARRCVSASVDEQQHGMSFSSKMRWLREKGDAKKLQQKLGSDKDDLILLLEAHNLLAFRELSAALFVDMTVNTLAGKDMELPIFSSALMKSSSEPRSFMLLLTSVTRRYLSD